MRNPRNNNRAAPPESITIATNKPVAPRARVRGGEVTMADACKMLHRKRSTVRKLIVNGKLPSEIRNSVHYFKRADVARLAGELGLPREQLVLSSSRGELAAEAFSLLKKGTPPVDIVIALKLTPDEVEELARKFASMTARADTNAPPCASCGEAFARFCGSCATKPAAPRG